MRGMIILFPVKPGEDPLKQGSWLRDKMRIVLLRSWASDHINCPFTIPKYLKKPGLQGCTPDDAERL